MPGEEKELKSFDSEGALTNSNIIFEYFKKYNVLTTSQINFKIGQPILIMRHLNSAKSLGKRTWLVVKLIHTRSIEECFCKHTANYMLHYRDVSSVGQIP